MSKTLINLISFVCLQFLIAQISADAGKAESGGDAAKKGPKVTHVVSFNVQGGRKYFDLSMKTLKYFSAAIYLQLFFKWLVFRFR